MSSYSTTATVHGEPIVRANPTGGPDTHDPDVVEVARNGLETHARDVVRITIAQGNGIEATAYLARETAEQLAEAILRAADLVIDAPQPEPRLAGGIGAESHPIGPRAGDRALRVVERAVSEATAIGVLRSELLLRVANGITGAGYGPVQYAAARAMGDAIDAAEGAQA